MKKQLFKRVSALVTSIAVMAGMNFVVWSGII